MNRSSNASDALSLLARILLALLFLGSGLSKLAAPAATQAYMAASGVPMVSLAYIAAVVAEVGGGLLLLVGYRARLAAFTLTAFTLAATVLFHSNMADQNQMIHMMKNLAIIGGLLNVAAFGAGRFSIDRRRVTAPTVTPSAA